MYNKTLSNNNNNEAVEEVVIKLNTDNLENSLCYRDEGNMNIVVSLIAHENDEKLVIRFKKIASDDETKSTFNELTAFVQFEKLLQKYFENSHQFTVVPKIVFFDVDVHALNSFLMRDRPAVRRNKIIGSNYGLLYRDVAFLPREVFLGKTINGEFKASPTVCIEIKAKQGYMMDDGDLKCRYCYFQYLKLRNAKVKSISNYCPIDLFSGNADRMNRAVKALIDNPQNNMKMFLDGKMVYNEYLTDKHYLRRVLFSLFPDTKCFEKQENLFVNLIRKVLLKDFTNCDSIADVCLTDNMSENIHTRQCRDKSVYDIPANCILSSILKAQLLVKDNFSQMEILEGRENCDMESQKMLQDYKIGSTALDCSLMLTLRKINRSFDESKTVVDPNHCIAIKDPSGSHHNFVVNTTIVDLDMKKDSVEHFRKYKRQYKESKIAYYNFIANEKIEFQD